MVDSIHKNGRVANLNFPLAAGNPRPSARGGCQQLPILYYQALIRHQGNILKLRVYKLKELCVICIDDITSVDKDTEGLTKAKSVIKNERLT
jgi:hypothetical protein